MTIAACGTSDAHELERRIRQLSTLVALARRCATSARRAPDPVAQFYDLARLDGALHALDALICALDEVLAMN